MTDPTVSCSRCRRDGPALAWPPYAGEVGQAIVRSICGGCWEEWRGVQTKLINEYRLNVLDPGHQQQVAEQCLLFLGLKEGTPVALPGEPSDPGGTGA